MSFNRVAVGTHFVATGFAVSPVNADGEAVVTDQRNQAAGQVAGADEGFLGRAVEGNSDASQRFTIVHWRKDKVHNSDSCYYYTHHQHTKVSSAACKAFFRLTWGRVTPKLCTVKSTGRAGFSIKIQNGIATVLP